MVRGYFSNIGVVMLNKYLLSIYQFRYPVFLTLMHMVTCSLLSMGVAATRLLPMHRVRSRQHLIKIAVLAAVFCVTVVLGNISLRFIPVSFNQAIGATTPAFTAVLHTLMTGEIESRGVYATLAPIVAGIVIASGAEPMFNLVGFLAAFSAVAGRALKSVLQAIGALQAAVVLGADGHFWGLLLLNCLLAYFANLTNFLVTKHTSALTLQVLGNAKGVVAVVVSVLYFQNPINEYTTLGYGVTVVGVVMYSKAKKAQKKALLSEQVASGVSRVELSKSDPERVSLIADASG
ncbi:hypothetical protein QBZ16_002084 [Prototheca wickerhamii]|uniref:Sugar phosphate transporter domain-containing protein n=1 Tax=Prototheca wickerhamii TaxID=3111 RepID=A0AAD9IM49_PROWI|nr:hypothetical protein QBZ16_002084 [Prototheca wickerhamii]